MIQVSQSVVGVKEGQEIKVEEKAVILVNDQPVSGITAKKDSNGKIVIIPRTKSK
jgi:hypothetical protein